MARFEVCITESRDLVFQVEAADADEAFEVANDLEANEAVRDSFRERIRDWVEPIKETQP